MKLARSFLIIAILGLVAGPAFAAVNDTHHDMSLQSTMGWRYQAKGTCYFCHGALDTSNITGYGTIGALCVSRCHGGDLAGVAFGGAVNEVVPAIAPVVAADNSETGYVSTDLSALTGGHGLIKGNLTTRINSSDATILSGIALPYTGGSETNIECTSCHNVHDNTKVPFLQGALATPSAVSFCEVCHNAAKEGRGNSWAGGEAAPNGEHPVNFALVLNDVATRTLGGRLGRYIQFDDGATYDVFDVDMTSAGADGDLRLNSVHYLTGGKAVHSDGIGMGEAATDSLFGCYTCHVTHQPNTNNNLVACDTVDATAGSRYNPLCTRCHGQAVLAVNANEWNPGLSDGGTGNNRVTYGHPNGVASNTGTVIDVANHIWEYNTAATSNFAYQVDLSRVANFASVPLGGVGYDESNGQIQCTSCHDVHGGDDDTMAIADLDGTYDGAASESVCYYCHTSMGIVDLPDNDGVAAASREQGNTHHPTSGANGSTTDADGNSLVNDQPSWFNAGAQANGEIFGDLTDGLACPDCHAGGNAGGTAHNW